jgi:hypothetical protein
MGYPYAYAANSLLLNEAGVKFIDSEFTLGVEPRLGRRMVTDYFILDCGGADKDHRLCEGQTRRVMFEGSASSRSAVLLDLDNDGDLDIVTNEMNDRPQLFFSNLAERRKLAYLKIKLVGAASNRDGIGALVKVTVAAFTQTQLHDGKSGYLSQSVLPLYFGLGQAAKVDRVEVLWPSGQRHVLEQSVVPNTLITVVER